MVELNLVSSSGLDTKALVLCDNACSNSWLALRLADRFCLQVKALKLTLNDIKTEDVFDTKVVELTEKPADHHDFEPFTINPFVKKSLTAGSVIRNVQVLQET